MKWQSVLCWWLIVFIAGCGSTGKEKTVKKSGGGYYLDDGPPKSSVDLSKVKDAVPHSEPLSATGNKPYVVFGKQYVPLKSNKGFRQKGTASWYGKKFHGKRTSSGEAYDMYKMTAAHTVLPIPSYARVTNLKNGRTVIVRVNDRGPFKHNRVMDLSYAAALKLDVVNSGTAPVQIVSINDDLTATSTQGNYRVARATPVTKIQTSPAAADGRLYIQLGAYSNESSAYSLQRRLVAAGYNNTSVSQYSRAPGKIDMYRVRIGPLDPSGDADFILADLHHAGYPNARFIVKNTQQESNN